MILWFEFAKVLSDKQIKELNKFIGKNYRKKDDNQNAAKTKDGKLLRTSEVYLTEWHKTKKYLNEAYQRSLYYVNHHFGFQTFPLNDYCDVNLNVYNSKTNSAYGWHQDSSHPYDNFDAKGTILINMSSKPYTGGKFYYYFNGDTVHVPALDTPGNVIVLRPGVFHKVDPVTSGERRTLSIFLTGPKQI
jgi:predicted 2-oxoglutarate/Fe(II)-dependent dioxygenase YbiX